MGLPFWNRLTPDARAVRTALVAAGAAGLTNDPPGSLGPSVESLRAAGVRIETLHELRRGSTGRYRLIKPVRLSSERAASMSAPAVQPGSHREIADDCRGEVFRLDGWRVVVCTDGFQWIVQFQACDKALLRGRCRAPHYCKCHRSLLRLSAASTDDSGAALAVLLPERIRLAAAQ